MSFMFYPYPYADPNAVNIVEDVRGVSSELVSGVTNVASYLFGLIGNGAHRIGVDCYPGTHVEMLINCLRNKVNDQHIVFVDANTLLKSPAELDELLKPYLPTDRDIDPTLLYGRRFEGGFEELQDSDAVTELQALLAENKSSVIVYGCGALSERLADLYDTRIWVDVTPRTAVLNFRFGHFRNLGAKEPLTYSLTMRRNYYVDFETSINLRWSLIRENKIDYYISADEPEKMQLLPFEKLLRLFDVLNKQPLRCRPVYLEGVWGGFFFKRLRNLPKAMRNCAWIFDMIPMEVSLVAKNSEFEFEVPFFTFVQAMGEQLLGKQAFEQFGGYFPIRFNYDDTYHSSGNMSIQCHPDAEYVIKNHSELGRQDESYYVCVAGQGAKTYLGFKNENSCEEFLEASRRAEKTGELIAYEDYINYVPSVPGTQVMIPAGTVHASGRNQVILEIGSLTIGSYTYKMYDYQRVDPQTGLTRPIHLKMGTAVIRKERTADWVKENLVNHGGIIRQEQYGYEKVVGEHDLLYFSLRNLVFTKEINDNTNGLFHVLTLTDGEKVRVESKNDPSKFYLMELCDVIVIPATFGGYRLINEGEGTVTVHKTLLKKEM